MKFLHLCDTRQSVRAYCDRAVERDKINRCIETARLAPSACNSQPWHFIVIDNPVKRKVVAEACHDFIMKGNSFALQAPVLIAVVAEQPNLTAQVGGWLKNKPYYLIDIGIAAEHLCLQAAEEGLGTCMIGWFNETVVRKTLSVPKNRRIPLIITVGYPLSKDVRKKVRKSIEEISSNDTYS